jgi:hypothetical protein
MESSERAPDPLDTAWAEVEAHWDDAAAHKKFLALADTLDRLPDAGRRYRAVREKDPERAERAKAQVDALFGIAMTRMKVEKSEPPKVRRRLDFIAFGISMALIAAALWSMLHGR